MLACLACTTPRCLPYLRPSLPSLRPPSLSLSLSPSPSPPSPSLPSLSLPPSPPSPSALLLQAYYYRSLCKLALHGTQQALPDINKALEIEPNQFEVLNCTPWLGLVLILHLKYSLRVDFVYLCVYVQYIRTYMAATCGLCVSLVIVVVFLCRSLSHGPPCLQSRVASRRHCSTAARPPSCSLTQPEHTCTGERQTASDSSNCCSTPPALLCLLHALLAERSPLALAKIFLKLTCMKLLLLCVSTSLGSFILVR